MPECWASAGFRAVFFYLGARLRMFGAPPAGGCPRRMAGRWNRIYRRPAPAAKPRGRGVSLIFNRIRPAIRPAREARRGGATASASAGGASSRLPFLTPQPPGCPLIFALGRGGLLRAGCGVSSMLRSLLAGSKPCRAPSAHTAPIPGAFATRNQENLPQ